MLRKEYEAIEKKLAKATKNILLLDAEQIPDAKLQMSEWKQRKRQIETEIAATEKVAPVEDLERLIKHVEQSLWNLREGYKNGDRKLLRQTLRSHISKISLAFDTVPHGKRNRHFLAKCEMVLFSGDIVQLANLSSTPQCTGQVFNFMTVAFCG